MTCGNSKDQVPDTGAGMTDQGASPSTPSQEDKAFNLARRFEATEYYRHRYDDRLCFNIPSINKFEDQSQWMFLTEDTVSPIWTPCHLHHHNRARRGVVLPAAAVPLEDEVLSVSNHPRRPVLGHRNLSLRDGTVLVERFMDDPRPVTGSKIKVRHPFNDTVITLTELYSLIPSPVDQADVEADDQPEPEMFWCGNGKPHATHWGCFDPERPNTWLVCVNPPTDNMLPEEADDKVDQPDAHRMLADAAAGFLSALAGAVDQINRRPATVEELITKNRAVYDAELEAARYIAWKQRFKVGDIITLYNYGRVRTDYDWLPCLGQVVPQTRFPFLFEVIGNTYGGGGDTFGIPSLGTGYFIKAK